MQLDSEPSPQRGGDQSRSRCRADQGKRLEGDVDGFGVHAAIDGEVDAEVLHGGVDKLLDDGGQSVDFVDEEDVAGLEVGEDAHEVGRPDQCRAGGGFEVGVHFVGDDVGDGGFAQSGRAVQQDVLDGLLSLFGGGQGDMDFFAEPFLADALVERRWSQGQVVVCLFEVAGDRVYNAFSGHSLTQQV